MTPLIAIHAFAALTSLLLGAWQLFLSPKGSAVHRLVGRVWVMLMLFVSISSFWITEIRPGRFSFLHVLSIVTVVTVSLGVIEARRGRIPSHLGNMCGSWIGLCFAFVFAIAIPARHIPQFILTEPLGAVVAGLVALATAAGVIGAGRMLVSTRALESEHA